ncbi:hypothetical protein [Guptibacillus algicola]|uniref:hypothetical protein n=1 Tax=Guptibacillus algicola TaxID=225844 RepID=UPI001CD6A38D|nr:hypothetical protein [Alkalihalobacillus algicola]MCA0988131.1 hypothetical protein [Alkalihalobacillus algicola]
MNKLIEKLVDKALSITKAEGKGKHVIPQERFCTVFKDLSGVRAEEFSYLGIGFRRYTYRDDDVFVNQLEHYDGDVLELDITEDDRYLHHYRSYEKNSADEKVTIPEKFVDTLIQGKTLE